MAIFRGQSQVVSAWPGSHSSLSYLIDKGEGGFGFEKAVWVLGAVWQSERSRPREPH